MDIKVNKSAEEIGDTGEKSALESLPIYQAYSKSPYLSIKHSSYFQVYSDLFESYVGKDFTFVEIGVLNGGSLFMWRDFFGENARIIGIDLNPEAARWERDGFEIFIGSQSDPLFWEGFFEKVGNVDVVLDDGGHTYEQQIITAHCCIPNINDRGLLVVEDTHTSYFKDFGYPSKYTFIEWVKNVIDNINNRFPSINSANQIYKNYVYSVRIFESITCFEINRRKCFTSKPTENSGKSLDAKDYRYVGTNTETISSIWFKFASLFAFLKNVPLARAFHDNLLALIHKLNNYLNNRKLKKYF